MAGCDWRNVWLMGVFVTLDASSDAKRADASSAEGHPDQLSLLLNPSRSALASPERCRLSCPAVGDAKTSDILARVGWRSTDGGPGRASAEGANALTQSGKAAPSEEKSARPAGASSTGSSGYEGLNEPVGAGGGCFLALSSSAKDERDALLSLMPPPGPCGSLP